MSCRLTWCIGLLVSIPGRTSTLKGIMKNNLKTSFGLPPSLAETLRRSMNEGNRLMSLAAQRMREQHAELHGRGPSKEFK